MYIDNEKYEKRLKQRGLTVNYLIEKTKTPRSTYYNFINGVKECTPEFLLLLANELVCPINYLIK